MARNKSAVLRDGVKAGCMKEVPYRIIIIGTLFLLIGGNWYLWRDKYYEITGTNWKEVNTTIHEHPHPPVRERCSSEYPNYSVVLDHMVTLPDGRVQVEYGSVYSLSAVWERDGIVRGCPCTIRPCIHSCCRKDQVQKHYILKEKNIRIVSCINVNGQSVNTTAVPSQTSVSQDLQLSSNKYFAIYHNCSMGVAWISVNFYKNGRPWDKNNNSVVNDADYCFSGKLTEMNSNSVFTCSSPPLRSVAPSVVIKYRLILKYSVIIFSMALHVMTLVVFALVPNVRIRYGTTVMAYLAAQLLNKTALVSSLFCSFDTIIGAVQYYCEVFYHICQIIIAFHIWRGMGSVLRKKQDKSISYKLVLCVALVSVLPTIYVCLRVDLAELMNPIVETLGEGKASLKIDTYIRQVWMMIPLLIAELLSMALCTASLCRMWSSVKWSNNFQGSDSKRHNCQQVEWYTVFIKLSLLTGMDYTVVTILNILQKLVLATYMAFVPLYVFYILRDINNLRGCEMFFIFILKPGVCQSLRRRFSP